MRVCIWQAEFEAEQEQLRTCSFLSEEKQKEYKERQSVSFMYMKPPGMDAANVKAAAVPAGKVSLLLLHPGPICRSVWGEGGGG